MWAFTRCKPAGSSAGSNPIEVSAKFGPVTDPVKFAEVEESVEWEMTFPGGLKTTCKTNYERGDMHGFTVTAEKGSFGLNPAYNYNSSRGTRSDGQAINLPAVTNSRPRWTISRNAS